MAPGELFVHRSYNTPMSVSSGVTGRFRKLRWRLTLTYTVVTVSVLLLVEVIVILVSSPVLLNLFNRDILPPTVIEAAMIDYVPTLRHYLEQEPPDRAGIKIWLERFNSSSTLLGGTDQVPVTLEPGELELSLIDEAGVPLGVSSPGFAQGLRVGEALDFTQVPGALADLFQAARSGETVPKNLFAYDDEQNMLFLAVPIYDSAQARLLGVLILKGAVPTFRTVLGNQFGTIAVSLLLFTLFAGLIGALFGSLASRGLVKRLDHIAEVTQAWSTGNFRISIQDQTRDELGELAERLNQMAGQLERTLETNREFAILEERNRLARDLHDSAKQQAFAAAGQVNAARTLLKRDPEGAQAHIDEAEILIRNLRRELGNLIRQLRPAELEGKGLAAALVDYAADWSRQTGISQEVLVSRERRLPLDIEQAVFRVMQEALANSARHSHASGVKIIIVYSDVDITCTLHDDGVGFDPGQNFTGFGLRSMRERVSAMAGTLRIESTPDSGTTLIINIPTSQKGSEDEDAHDE